MKINKSTLIAGIGVLLFVLIVGAVVAVNSRGNEFGRVYNTKEGNAKDLMRIFEQSAGANESVHAALREKLGIQTIEEKENSADSAIEAQ